MVEIIYKVPDTEVKTNTNYVGIDLGLNNLATVGGNTITPIIINGKPLKSINQFYNKKLSKLKSKQDLCKNKNVNRKKIQTLTNKRTASRGKRFFVFKSYPPHFACGFCENNILEE